MGIVAIIPARGGSKGIPKKNIYPLKTYPLIAYSIVAAQFSKQIERTVVSTDSTEIAEIAQRYGAEVPFLRPSELAKDHSTDRDFLLHAIQWFQNNEKNIPKYWVHLRPTTPLRDPAIIDRAISTILEKKEATALRSGHPVSESPFKWFQRNESGYFEGILPDDPRPEYYNLPRQEFPPVYIPDGYVDILKTSFVSQSISLHGNKMLGFISPVCDEVDTLEDLERIQFHLEKNGSLLLEYLKKKF